MKKLWLIIKREYLVRVRKKSFILITLLAPLAIIAFYAIIILIALQSGEERSFVFKDESGIFQNIPSSNGKSKIHFTASTKSLDDLRKTYREDGYDGVLHIPEFKSVYNNLKVNYYSDQQISVSNQGYIERRIRGKIRDHKMKLAGLTQNQLDSLDTSVDLVQSKEFVGEDGAIVEEDGTASAGIATAISFGMSFFMYMVIFIYGMMVMRSVMEEKVNRIVEVIISSVRPFQLMLGKIIGVSGVGLTQMLIWIVVVTGAQFLLAPLLIGADGMPDPGSTGISTADAEEGMAMVQTFMTDLASQDWGFILPILIFFFVGGYFIYASLFAAVGSAIGDDYGEGQSLTIPVVIPVVIAFVIATTVIDNPDSSLAVFGSFFPLFSPIVMPARLAFDPPLWEVLLSMAILAGSVVFFVWLSGRIYRIGIFMYGKKVTLKEVGKWLFYK